jgi:LysR family hydrogen peroxide-inducible transcriptional activator
VAIKKLEDELGVVIFERGGTEVSVTPLGAQIVAQAERVLEQTAAIKEIANQNKDPLSGPCAWASSIPSAPTCCRRWSRP